jgi:hypothetical protein
MAKRYRVRVMISQIKRYIKSRQIQKLAHEDTRIDISLEDFYNYKQSKMKRVFKMSSLEKPDSSLEMVRNLRYVQNLTSILPMCAEDIDTLFNIFSVTMLPGARMTDSLNLLEDSIVLALSGRYSAAHSLLRLAYESLIVGGFYHVLAYNPTKMLSRIRSFNGRGKYPKPFGAIVEDILENLTPEERIYTSFMLENKIEKFFQNHEPKLIPPGFSYMLSQVCGFYALITPKYKKRIRELYDELSTYIHTMQNASYEIRYWRLGVVFSAERLHIFQSTFLFVLDMIGYLYNIIMAVFYSFPDVVSHTIDFMDRFKVEGESLKLTNHIISGLCDLSSKQNEFESQ